MPNIVKVSLSDAVIEKVESAIAKGSGKKLLPEEALRFFIVLDWVDRSVRKPGSLSRGAYRVKRDPCADRALRPTVAATFNGLQFSAYFEAHKVWISSEPIPFEEFRAKVRDMRAREVAASIEAAMPAGNALATAQNAMPDGDLMASMQRSGGMSPL